VRAACEANPGEQVSTRAGVYTKIWALRPYRPDRALSCRHGRRVALSPGRSSVPKRSGLLLQFTVNVPKMCPTSIDTKEFTEQTEPRGERVCAGKVRRNSFGIRGITLN
jgi:hypothetical protein